MLQTILITVAGKVQGVFYRQSTVEIARALGITGHVQNLADGSVAVLATGTAEQLDKLVTWCRQGPPKARVTGVELRESSLQQFERFSILRR